MSSPEEITSKEACQKHDRLVERLEKCGTKEGQFLASCNTHVTITPFVEEFGQFFEAQSLPTKYDQAKRSLCYENAFWLAIEYEDLTYVEGFAKSPGGRWGVLHAWCVDPHGRVIDNTWLDAAESSYFGIPFKTAFLSQTVKKYGRYGLLDDIKNRWPLINQLGDQPELWLGKGMRSKE